LTTQWSGQGLPPVAQARVDGIHASGTWGSSLSTDEFAAIKEAGFDPVGQVLGAAVYNMGYRGAYGCPSGVVFGSYNRLQPRWQPGYTSLSSQPGAMYAPMVQTMYAARRKAISRMVAECAALGGHGVVGVRLSIRRFQFGVAMEFNAIGTAVRARGAAPPLQRPFTSDLSGQDFAKLIADGVVPVGLVLGISIGSRHDDWMTRSQTRWTAGNTEIGGYTELVNMTRHDARNELAQDVARLGAEGVVLQEMDLQVGERECGAQEGARDHIAEASIIGTAIVHFAKSARGAERPSLAIISLDPERRRAVRRRGISN
jgi:uncharacterized protein YbjQ (UPF0145 family)